MAAISHHDLSPEPDLTDPSIIERRNARSRWLMLAPALVILIVAAVGPLIVVVIYSFLTAGDYGGVIWQFSLDGWINVFAKRDIFDGTISLANEHLWILWRSVKLAFLTTALCLLLGFPTAYFIATRAPDRRDLWMLLIIIPFWTNLLIRTFAIMALIRNDGLVNSLLMASGIVDAPIQILYTDFAILLGMTYVYLPLMILPLYAAMERLNFSLVEATYDLYATRRRALFKVIIPVVMPGIVSGSILVFVPALGAYVTPRVLGGGNQLMLGNLIDLQFGQARNWPLGAALSLTLLIIVTAALLVYIRSADKEDKANG